MLFPSLGGYMLKNTKDIIFFNLFFLLLRPNKVERDDQIRRVCNAKTRDS